MATAVAKGFLAAGLAIGITTAAVYALRLQGAGDYVVEEAMVLMHDGVRLHTMVWRPHGPGRYPAVLTRGYNSSAAAFAEPFVRSGYAYVGQSTRGHGPSEGTQGVRHRFFDDAEDGYNTLTWISQQPWSDGKIAMYGKSYWAATQWLVAPLEHPNLKAIIPQNINPDLWERSYWDHGALQLAHTARRIYDAGGREKIEQFGWMNWYRHLPLMSLDVVAGTSRNVLWRDYLSHPRYDDFWRKISIREKYDKVRIPVYFMAGWYDNYPGAALTYFQKLKELNPALELRIVVDASDHLNRTAGDRDFGKAGIKDEITLAIRWLNYVVKGFDNGMASEPPIAIFVMGANGWRHEYEWPLAGTQFTKYFFHSEDGSRRGKLNPEFPGDEQPTSYIYDPFDPVPTLGGNHSFTDNSLSHIIRAGSVDQRPNESRHDVLVFTSGELAEDVEVTGPIVIVLYAASSAEDTDFTATLIDVDPKGPAYNLTQGIIRARFRESIWEPPRLLVPGTAYEYRLELLPTSNVFKKGHKIQVHLTSSNFPLYDRNPNTGSEQGIGKEIKSAKQTVYHDKTKPSHIILPVVSRR
ncbi:CocE/NonD family hydrolase [Nitrospira sp. Nam80]